MYLFSFQTSVLSLCLQNPSTSYVMDQLSLPYQHNSTIQRGKGKKGEERGREGGREGERGGREGGREKEGTYM